MRNKLKLVLAAVLLLPIFSSGLSMYAYAVEDSSNSTTTTTTTESTDPDTTVDGIKERLQAKKTELKTKLAAAEETKIKNKCKAAQGLVMSLQGRIKGIETSRGNVNGKTQEKLTELIEKLKTKGVDTAQLESEVTELQKLVETYKTDLATYKQTVSDLANVDCQSDPTAFKTALEAARAAREKVSTDIKAIRTYVTDTIKPTLQQIRAQLESSTNTESQ